MGSGRGPCRTADRLRDRTGRQSRRSARTVQSRRHALQRHGRRRGTRACGNRLPSGAAVARAHGREQLLRQPGRDLEFCEQRGPVEAAEQRREFHAFQRQHVFRPWRPAGHRHRSGHRPPQRGLRADARTLGRRRGPVSGDSVAGAFDHPRCSRHAGRPRRRSVDAHDRCRHPQLPECPASCGLALELPARRPVAGRCRARQILVHAGCLPATPVQ